MGVKSEQDFKISRGKLLFLSLSEGQWVFGKSAIWRLVNTFALFFFLFSKLITALKMNSYLHILSVGVFRQGSIPFLFGFIKHSLLSKINRLGKL